MCYEFGEACFRLLIELLIFLAGGFKELLEMYELIVWLRQEWENRVLVLDTGYFEKAQAMFEKLALKNDDFARKKGYELKKVTKSYRKPMLVGVPFNKSDSVFGELIRDAVDEVLYTKYTLDVATSPVAEALAHVGITVLDRNTEVWEPVDIQFYPRSVLEPQRLAQMRKR